MRFLSRAVVALIVLAGCSATHIPDVSAPAPIAGVLSARAALPEAVGQVQPVALALTNGTDGPVQIDPSQIYARADDDTERVTALPAEEAARRAGGKSIGSSTVKRGAVGAASGGVLGAIGGAISGAIQGGIGGAVAAGAAAGSAIGAIGGVLSGAGSEPAPRTAEFAARALPGQTLVAGASVGGLLYYPPGHYTGLEVLGVDPRTDNVVHVTVSLDAVP